MIPLLIATARSGSSIISNLMYQLGKEEIGYKNYLNEFFTVTELYQSSYEIIDGKITQVGYDRKNKVWYSSAREERLKRLDMIRYDPCYALKVFPEDIEPEILDFLKQNYKIIGLERKDKLDQFISFSHMLSTNTASYSIDDKTIIDSIHVDKLHLAPFINHIKNFKKLQQELKFPVIYYEDYCSSENKAEFLCEEFQINFQPIKINIESKETPYIEYEKRKVKEELILIKLTFEKIF